MKLTNETENLQIYLIHKCLRINLNNVSETIYKYLKERSSNSIDKSRRNILGQEVFVMFKGQNVRPDWSI